MATVVTGTGPEDMRALARRLREADPHLRRALLRELRRVTAPVVKDVQASILAMPAEDKDHAPHLRREIAATVSASVGLNRTGVRVNIISSGSKMPPGMSTLPKHTDSSRGWSHPVFAQGARFHLGRSHARRYRYRPQALRPLVHRASWTWAHQLGKPQWFEGAIASDAREVQDACQAAINDTARMLES